MLLLIKTLYFIKQNSFLEDSVSLKIMLCSKAQGPLHFSILANEHLVEKGRKDRMTLLSLTLPTKIKRTNFPDFTSSLDVWSIQREKKDHSWASRYFHLQKNENDSPRGMILPWSGFGFGLIPEEMKSGKKGMLAELEHNDDGLSSNVGVNPRQNYSSPHSTK